MKVIYNRLIPFKGYKAINLFGVLFVREGCSMSAEDFNHESIHTAQMKEMLYVFFYIFYVLEWLYRLLRLKNSRKAYRSLSFEREAYANQSDMDYLNDRPMYNQYKLNDYGTDQ